MGAKSVRRALRLSPELDAAVERARGDVSWSRWVTRAIEGRLTAEGHVWATVVEPVGVRPDPSAGSLVEALPEPVRTVTRPSVAVSPLAARQAALNKAKGLES